MQRIFGGSKVLVDLDTATRVARVCLHDPSRLNALDVAMGREFREAVDVLKQLGAPQLGAMVLYGSGRAFSAGGDLAFLAERAKDTPWNNVQVMRDFYARFLAVREVPVPTIGASIAVHSRPLERTNVLPALYCSSPLCMCSS